jgi:hypothetical protein
MKGGLIASRKSFFSVHKFFDFLLHELRKCGIIIISILITIGWVGVTGVADVCVVCMYVHAE